jgi:hypothetical protein
MPRFTNYVITWVEETGRAPTTDVIEQLARSARANSGELLALGPVHDVSERQTRPAPEVSTPPAPPHPPGAVPFSEWAAQQDGRLSGDQDVPAVGKAAPVRVVSGRGTAMLCAAACGASRTGS